MTERRDINYYTAREIVSRRQADAATDVSARIAHIAAADGYATRIVELRTVLAAR